jgi:hypothetical protein
MLEQILIAKVFNLGGIALAHSLEALRRKSYRNAGLAIN